MVSESNLIISGLTSTGKTTHALILAGQFALRYVSASRFYLYRCGKRPYQDDDFWVSDEAFSMRDIDNYKLADQDVIEIESRRNATVFDAIAMPWIHKRPALCIWLESSIESRVMKAQVSHRGQVSGNGKYDSAELRKRIIDKDELNRQRIKDIFDVDIYSDRRPFQLLIDISSLISAPTWEAALVSIEKTHGVIEAAVRYYLTRDKNNIPDLRQKIKALRADGASITARDNSLFFDAVA